MSPTFLLYHFTTLTHKSAIVTISTVFRCNYFYRMHGIKGYKFRYGINGYSICATSTKVFNNHSSFLYKSLKLQKPLDFSAKICYNKGAKGER